MKIRSKATPTPLEEKQKKGKRRTDRKKFKRGEMMMFLEQNYVQGA